MEERYIICDTNVWLDLASNPRLFNAVIDNKLKLVPTAIALKELVTKKRTIEGKNGQVFTCMRRFMSDARIYMPFIHLFRTAKQLVLDSEFLELNRKIVQNLHNRVPFQSEDRIKKKFSEDFEAFKNLRLYFNEQVQNRRNDYNPKVDVFDTFYSRSLPSLVNLLNEGIALENNSNEIKVEVSKIDLFLRTALYFDWTKITESIKTVKDYEDNDFNDIFNLIYVAPGELFWTVESRRKQNFKKAIIDSGNESFLFDPNEEWNKYLTNRY
jgi:hypothetical protein